MPDGINGYVWPEPPRALLVARVTASVVSAVVGPGCNIERADRAMSIEQARAKQRQWSLEGKASMILALDRREGIETDAMGAEALEAVRVDYL
jgi:hypothetical protein